MKPIPLTPCGSSNIQATGYDAATKTLAVQFKNATYHYPDVPADLHAAFNDAESKGKFFHENIKGNFPGTKFEPDPEQEAA